MHFAAIPGHTPAKQHLLQMAHHRRIPHALLLSGPEGSASLALSLALTQYIHCTQTQPKDSCGKCASCIQVQQGTHPDVHFLFPQPASQQGNSTATYLPAWRSFLQKHPYGDIRDWLACLSKNAKRLYITKAATKQLQQVIGLKPFIGQSKTILLWLPEYLHTAAAHALLKLVEEPPAHTVCLLVSSAPTHILPTLRSRAFPVTVPPFTVQDLVRALAQQHPELPEEARLQAATAANGNLGQALKWVANSASSPLDSFSTWMRLCYAHHWTHLLQQAEAFQQQHPENQKNILIYGLNLVRAALVTAHTQEQLVQLTPAEKHFIQKFGTTLSLDQKAQIATYLEQMYQALVGNAHPKLLFMHTSLHLADLFKSSIAMERRKDTT